MIVYNVQHPRHGMNCSIPKLVGLLKEYGTLAKPVLPTVKEAIKKAFSVKKPDKEYLQDLEKKYKEIENSSRTPELRSIEKYLKEPLKLTEPDTEKVTEPDREPGENK